MASISIVMKDGEQIVTISSDEAELHMRSEEMIYLCESDEHPDHEYHLNPQKLFTSVDVEYLLANLE